MVMKKILLITTGILLLLSIPVTVFFIGQGQELRKKAAPATTLTLSPSTISANPGDTLLFNVEINTATNQVATAQIVLTFDQTKAQALSITSGPQAPRILTQGITGPGTASITVGAQSTAKPITGTGIIAVVRLKILDGASGPFALQFDPTTFIGGLGEKDPNVLVSKTDAQIILPTSTAVGGGTSTFSSQTSTITPSPIASPTAITTIQPPNLTSELIATSSPLTVAIASNPAVITKPIIKGTAPPGSTVTIVIHSETQTVVVTADENGNYQYIPTTTLSEGSHTVVVTSQDTSGKTQTASSSFAVGSMLYAEPNDTATGEAMPQSGSTLPLILLSMIGLFLFGGGMSMVYLNKRYGNGS